MVGHMQIINSGISFREFGEHLSIGHGNRIGWFVHLPQNVKDDKVRIIPRTALFYFIEYL